MLSAGVLLLATPSCKKGENDPFMSLSSRTGRISGEWKLTEASVTTKSQYEDWWTTDKMEDEYVYTYDGTTMTLVHTERNLTDNSSTTDPAVTYSYSEMSTFEKDGNFEWTRTIDGDTETGMGFWYFTGKSKANEMKKKEGVIISMTQTVSSGNTYTYAGAAISPDQFHLIDRLTGKEMVTKMDFQATDPDGLVDSESGTMTWEKQ